MILFRARAVQVKSIFYSIIPYNRSTIRSMVHSYSTQFIYIHTSTHTTNTTSIKKRIFKSILKLSIPQAWNVNFVCGIAFITKRGENWWKQMKTWEAMSKLGELSILWFHWFWIFLLNYILFALRKLVCSHSFIRRVSFSSLIVYFAFMVSHWEILNGLDDIYFWCKWQTTFSKYFLELLMYWIVEILKYY